MVASDPSAAVAAQRLGKIANRDCKPCSTHSKPAVLAAVDASYSIRLTSGGFSPG